MERRKLTDVSAKTDGSYNGSVGAMRGDFDSEESFEISFLGLQVNQEKVIINSL